MDFRYNKYLFFLCCVLLLSWASTTYAGSALLKWQSNSEPDVQSYNIYYGLTSRNYGPPIPVGNTDTYTVDYLENDRTYYFAVTAVDSSGNESGFSIEKSKLVTGVEEPVDNIAPVVTIKVPTELNNYTTNSAQITIAGTADDANSIERVSLSLPSGAYGTAIGTNNWSISGTLPAEGLYELTVSAEDAFGNIGNDTITINYTTVPNIDSTPPTIDIISPCSSGTCEVDSPILILAGTAADNNDLQQIAWGSSTGQSGIASGTNNWTVSNINLTEGQNTLSVTATDTAGNSNSDTVIVTYTPPQNDTVFTLKMSSSGDLANPLPLNGQTVSNDMFVFLTPEEDVSKVTFALDGQKTRDESQAPFELGFSDTTMLSDGPHSASAQITLNDGTTKSTSATFTVLNGQTTPPPDVTAPSVSITSPTTSGTYQTDQGSLTLSGSAQDNTEVANIRWANSTGGSGTASGTTQWSVGSVALQEGTNTITVTATDTAGNSGTAVLTVVYNSPDVTAPTIQISEPTSTGTFSTNNANINLAGTASDDRDLIEVTWSSSNGSSGSASGSTNWSISGINVAGDETIITVTAMDSAGNKSAKKLTVTYAATTDNTAPTVQITSPTTKASFFARTSKVDIGGTASDNNGIEKIVWQNSRGETGTCEGKNNWQASNIPLDRWWNTITVTAYDNTGNIDQKELKIFRWR